jgi:signal recognition particle GTPase
MENRSIKPETQENIEKYMAMVKALDPDLYEIKLALLETNVNSELVLHIIKKLALAFYGSGWGKLIITFEDRKATIVKIEETQNIDMPVALLSKEK